MKTRALRFLAIAAVMLWILFPFYWAVVTSLKSGTALFRLELWPASPAWGNYLAVFREQPFGMNLLNSAGAAVGTVAVALGAGLLAAYPLSKSEMRGRGWVLCAFLLVSMFPQIAILSGLFELIRGLGLFNRLPGLVIAYLIFTLPFTVWTLTSFLRALPRQLEEAALLEGASRWQVLTRVLLPLLAPAMVTTGLLAFIGAWNEFLFALTLTISERARTVPVAIAQMTGASQHELPWGVIMAASVVVTLPVIALVMVFQKRVVSGLTAGAVKG